MPDGWYAGKTVATDPGVDIYSNTGCKISTSLTEFEELSLEEIQIEVINASANEFPDVVPVIKKIKIGENKEHSAQEIVWPETEETPFLIDAYVDFNGRIFNMVHFGGCDQGENYLNEILNSVRLIN